MAITILQKETYLAMIRNAEGSNLFRNLFVLYDGEKQDILKDGMRSCAAFVGSTLYHFGLTSSLHTTIAGLLTDMGQSGWRITETPREGDVILWEPMLQGDEVNAHVGFFLGSDQAICNNWEKRCPAVQHLTYGSKEDGSPVRAVTAFYTHDFLA